MTIEKQNSVFGFFNPNNLNTQSQDNEHSQTTCAYRCVFSCEFSNFQLYYKCEDTCHTHSDIWIYCLHGYIHLYHRFCYHDCKSSHKTILFRYTKDGKMRFLKYESILYLSIQVIYAYFYCRKYHTHTAQVNQRFTHNEPFTTHHNSIRISLYQEFCKWGAAAPWFAIESKAPRENWFVTNCRIIS